MSRFHTFLRLNDRKTSPPTSSVRQLNHYRAAYTNYKFTNTYGGKWVITAMIQYNVTKDILKASKRLLLTLLPSFLKLESQTQIACKFKVPLEFVFMQR